MKPSPCLLQGNQAIAEGALYAGARFFAGYPITPSSEIAEVCSRRLPACGGFYLQMEDEIASIAAVIGASLAGARAFTATSGPGFSLMQENLGLAVLGEIPCVIVNVQRSGPSTGLATKPAQADIMQTRWGRHGDQALIALCPATVAECFALTVKAFALAERFRVPVVLLADEIVAHMREKVALPAPGEWPVADRPLPAGDPAAYLPFAAGGDEVAPLASFGGPYVFHVSSSMHGPDGCSDNDPDNAAAKIAHLHAKLEAHRDELVLTRTFDCGDAEALIITLGAATRAGREAAREARRIGIRAGVLQIQTIWPFPDDEVKDLGRWMKRVVVPEMNYSGQVAAEVRRVLGTGVEIRRVNRWDGQVLTPQAILAALTGREGRG